MNLESAARNKTVWRHRPELQFCRKQSTSSLLTPPPSPPLPAFRSTFSLMCSRDLLWRRQRRDIKQTIQSAVQTRAENILFAFVCLPRRLFPIRNVPDMMVSFPFFFFSGWDCELGGCQSARPESDASESLVDETWQRRTIWRMFLFASVNKM